MYPGSRQVRDWCNGAKVIPVLTIENIEHAVPLARALAAGGVKVIEITLRTECALAALEKVSEAVPELCVAVGTVRTQGDVYRAKKHKAHFAISPGTTLQLLDAAFDAVLPIMPGVATASEVMQWSEYGVDTFKFFPAEQMGGVATLKAFHPPLPGVCFCPTGGVNESNARAYLDLPNVIGIGGSWLVSAEQLAGEDWDGITKSAARAMAL